MAAFSSCNIEINTFSVHISYEAEFYPCFFMFVVAEHFYVIFAKSKIFYLQNIYAKRKIFKNFGANCCANSSSDPFYSSTPTAPVFWGPGYTREKRDL